MPETNFFWDPYSDNILQERDETGAVTAEYTTEPGLYGNLISQNRGGVERQHHFDALGSTLALTDDNQQVTDTSAYTAFGEVTEQSGSSVNPFEYAGQKGYRRDAETGDYSVRQRPLLPMAGRWLSADIDHLQTEGHAFVYVGNRPTLKVDPSGQLAIVVTVVNVGGNTKCDPTETTRPGIGGFAQFKFALDQGAPCDGYIIQHVEWICVDQKCRCGCPPTIDPKNRKSITYLETFGLIKKGNTRNIYRDRTTNLPINHPYDDEAESPISAGTCGTFLQYGQLRFYCKSDIGNEISAVQNPALDPTSEWKLGRDIGMDFGTDCAPGKMDLATFIRKDARFPPGWSNKALAKAVASRTFAMDWDCCFSPGRVSVGANEGIREP